MKKIISILLVCAMLFAAAPIGAVASDEAVAVAVDTVIAAPGDTGVEVKVMMTAEPHWAGVDMEFSFDAETLVYKGFRRNPALEAQASAGDVVVCVINAESAAEGEVSVHFASAGDMGGYFGYFPDGCDYFGVLLFDVASGAAEGLSPVSVNITSLTNFETEAVPFTLAPGGVNVTACEHAWEVTARAEADCETDGYTDYLCSICGAARHENVPARGHYWNEIGRVEPTADTEGSVAYECVWCGRTRTEILSVLPPFDGVRVRVEKAAADPGAKNVEVKVYIEDTPHWSSLSFEINFDPEVMTYKSFIANPAIMEQREAGETIISLINKEDAADGKVFILYAFAYDTDGYEGYHSGGYDYFGTLRFNIADSAVEGFSPIGVTVTKLADYMSTPVPFEQVDGGVRVSCLHEWEEVERAEYCEADGYAVYKCSGCGEYKRETLAPAGHVWGEWETVSEATCAAREVQRRVCERDGTHIETREVGDFDLENGHAWGEWTETSPATCTEAAVETRVCERDGTHTETREGRSALGHDHVGVTTAPTCTEGGFTTYTCSRCGDGYVADKVEALGHAWGEWAVTRKQTFYRAGEETRSCTRCEEVETHEIPRYLKGDMDFDGAITVGDALSVLRIAAHLAQQTELSLAVADTDRDGEITVADALTVLRRSVRLIPEEEWIAEE